MSMFEKQLRRLTIELPDRRTAVLWLPADYDIEDMEAIRLHLELWTRIRGQVKDEETPVYVDTTVEDEEGEPNV